MRFTSLALTLFIACPAGAQSDAVRALISSPQASFGETHQFTTVKGGFHLENPTSQELRIRLIEAISNVATVEPDAATIPPGGQLDIRLHQPVGNRLGETSFRARLVFADGSERKLLLEGFVQSAYDPERVLLTAGRVAVEQGAALEVAIATREGTGLEILGLDEDTPAWLAWRPRAGSKTAGSVEIVAGRAPLGLRELVFALRTNLAVQPRAEVRLSLEVVGDLVPDRPQFDMASIHLGKLTEAAIELRSRSGRRFKLDPPTASDSRAAISAAPCFDPLDAPDGTATCWRLELRVEPLETGMFEGTVRVSETGAAQPLEFPFAALVVQPNTAIKTIRVPGAIDSFSDLLVPPESAANPLAPAALPHERPQGPSTTPAEPTRRRAVTLRWRVRNDEGTYGYLVYRAPAPEGPFLRLNPQIIRPSRLEFDHLYSFEDRTVEPGRTYWYTVDVVSTGGRKMPLTPVLPRAVALDAQP